MTTAVYSHTRPSVLVIGGGYGGIAVAKGLDDVADVTLVEPKDAFVYNVDLMIDRYAEKLGVLQPTT
jgi:NADH dehydrogenase FAD-containing subunit